MIESAIVGRQVFTVLLPEFHDNQEGTVHFHYLLDGPDALLRASRSLDDHALDITQVLDGHDPDPDRSARFVKRFVRPRGLDIAATTLVVDAIETLASRPAPAPLPVPGWTKMIRALLRPFATAAAARARRIHEAFRNEKKQLLLEHRQRKALLRDN
jgi:hypothetical protein